MTRRAMLGACLAGVLAMAVGLRVGRLSRRPMHTDEAVHTVKFGHLLQGQGYRYDPHEFHGPTLNYLTWPVMRACGVQQFSDTLEWQYRLVPVVFGLALVLLTWWLFDGLGRLSAAAAAWLTALSPAMVFYSGYYVQEMLLVCFSAGTIVCGWRYGRTRRLGWMLATGVCAGLMHATKETCVIALGVMTGALLVVRFLRKRKEDALPPAGTNTSAALHVGMGVVCAVVVSIAFYSSFFTHWGGVVDSVTAIGTYVTRAGGAGSAANHEHPWWYYLRMLAWFKYGPGPWWSEGLVLVLAVAGLIAVISGRLCRDAHKGLVRFVAVYAVGMVVVYSAIPYKTPWSMLGFLHGLILLAGLGASALVRWAPTRPGKTLVGLLLIVGVLHLAWQSDRATGRFATSPRNPYVYAHTGWDLPQVTGLLELLSGLDGSGASMRIDVVAPDDDVWPLPWYLRRFDGAGVHYRRDLSSELDARVVVAHQGVNTESLPGRYISMASYGLRPDVRVTVWVYRELWQEYLNRVE